MSATRERITISMTTMEVFVALSEGNPGAISVLMKLMEGDDATSFLGLLQLDSLGIYGPRIWMLYKDVCGQRLPVMRKLLLAVFHGDVTREALDRAIENRGAGLDLSPYAATDDATESPAPAPRSTP